MIQREVVICRLQLSTSVNIIYSQAPHSLRAHALPPSQLVPKLTTSAAHHSAISTR